MERTTVNVLVVDDDPAVRRAIALRLSAVGHRVHTVACGEDGLLACSPEPPDIIILDVSMPSMDGFKVCELIRESIDSPIGVIFLTGTTHCDSSPSLAQRVDQCGGDYFLAKPYDPTLLVELVDRIAASELRSHAS